MIEEVIGRGGMSVVYRAIHPEIGSRVAIKVLAMDRLRDPLNVTRFIQEARTANEIRHHNIVDVYTVGHLPSGQVYCVMEYLEGTSLMHHLGMCGRLSLAETLEILEAIAGALDAAHAKGVVHRDIKPANIFLVRASDTGAPARVKLLDFGIAKVLGTDDRICTHHTQTGTVIGTPAYMSPEQCRGKDVGPRADIYCLGVMAYEMLTGRLPYTTDSFGELLLLHQTQLPTPPSKLAPSVPPSVDAPLLRAMHKEPSRRFASASELVAALAAATSQAHPIAVPPEPVAQLAPHGWRRWWWAPFASAALVLAVVLARMTVAEAPSAAAATLDAPAPRALAVPAAVTMPAPAAPPPVAPKPRPKHAAAKRAPAPPAPRREVIPDLPVKF